MVIGIIFEMYVEVKEEEDFNAMKPMLEVQPRLGEH